MTKQYIYLDWNVFQYAKSPRNGKNDEDLGFIISNVSKRYHIPYSEAHLSDLASGYSENKKQYIEEDLKLIDKITSSDAVVWSFDQGKDILAVHRRNCRADFQDILNRPTTTEKPNASFSLSKEYFPIDSSKMEKDDIFFSAIQNNGGKLNSAAISQLMQEIWDKQNDPDFYKKFRSQVQRLSSNFEKRDQTVLSKDSETYKSIIPFLKYLSSENEEEAAQLFPTAVNSFASFSGRKLDTLTTGDKIELAYSLSDMHPKFSEKITNKNRPSNQLRDSRHFFWASNAKYYVTEDARTQKKAQLVLRSVDLNVKVIGISELISRFS